MALWHYTDHQFMDPEMPGLTPKVAETAAQAQEAREQLGGYREARSRARDALKEAEAQDAEAELDAQASGKKSPKLKRPACAAALEKIEVQLEGAEQLVKVRLSEQASAQLADKAALLEERRSRVAAHEARVARQFEQLREVAFDLEAERRRLAAIEEINGHPMSWHYSEPTREKRAELAAKQLDQARRASSRGAVPREFDALLAVAETLALPRTAEPSSKPKRGPRDRTEDLSPVEMDALVEEQRAGHAVGG